MELFSDKAIDKVREFHSTTKVEVQRLSAQLKEVKDAEKIWATFIYYLEKKWIFHILSLIPHIKKINPNIQNEIALIEKKADDEAKNILLKYPKLLETACNSANIDLDLKSPHPKYKIADGFFQLEIDEKKRTARLFDIEKKLAEFPADIDVVIEKIKKEVDRIFNREVDMTTFLATLAEQYESYLQSEELPEGSSMPIRELTRRLALAQKGFQIDEFLLDLSNLADKGPNKLNNKEICLQHTKDRKKGMLLHGKAVTGLIGFIVFKET